MDKLSKDETKNLPETENNPNESELQAFGGKSTATLLGFSTRTKVVAAGLIVALIVALTVTLALQYITPHFSIEELISEPLTPEGQFIAVEGRLVPGSYVQSADGLVSSFRLVDDSGSETVSVTYGLQEGADVGQLFFNEHSTILVQGRKVSGFEFEASRLTVKCPTKYQADGEAYDATYTTTDA